MVRILEDIRQEGLHPEQRCRWLACSVIHRQIRSIGCISGFGHAVHHSTSGSKKDTTFRFRQIVRTFEILKSVRSRNDSLSATSRTCYNGSRVANEHDLSIQNQTHVLTSDNRLRDSGFHIALKVCSKARRWGNIGITWGSDGFR